jgi:hypothetical protein
MRFRSKKNIQGENISINGAHGLRSIFGILCGQINEDKLGIGFDLSEVREYNDSQDGWWTIFSARIRS